MILLKRLQVRALKQLRDIDIHFPRRGSILVEGQNEAGKSTLFEAVYFALYGSALTGEDTRATLDDLIPHGLSAAHVALTIVIGDAELAIRRVVQRRPGRRATQESELRVRRPGLALESIHATRAVNDRILDELHGLDGDTLRNSCFMEQKALDRLESLSRREREAAVARLLGIERLQRVERDLQEVTNQLEQQADLRRATLDVAVARRTASDAEEQERRLAARLAAVRVLALIERRDTHASQQQDDAERDARLEDEWNELEARLDRIRSLQEVETELASVARLLDEMQSVSARMIEVERRFESQSHVITVELPQVRQRIADLTRAEHDMSTLSDLHRQHAALAEALRAEAAARSLWPSLQSAQSSVNALEVRVARCELRDAVTRWLQVNELHALASDGAQRAETLARQALAAERERRVARSRLRVTAGLAALAVLATAIEVWAGLSWPILWYAAGITLLAAVILLARVPGGRKRLACAERACTTLHTERTELRIRREAASELLNKPDTLLEIENDLRALHVAVPQSRTDALELLASTTESESVSIRQLQAQLDEARRACDRQSAAFEAAESVLRAALAMVTGDASSEDLMDRLASVSEEEARLTASLRELLTAAKVAEDVAAIAAARGSAERQQTDLTAQVADYQSLCDSMAALRTQVTTASADAEARLLQMSRQAVQLGLAVHAEPIHDDIRLQIVSHHADLSRAVRDTLYELDEKGTLVSRSVLAERMQALRARGAEVRLTRDEVVSRMRAALSDYDVACTGEESFVMLAERWPVLHEARHDTEASLEEAWRGADREAHHLRAQAVDLAERLQLSDAHLDETEIRVALSESERTLRHHVLALEMAQAVRARIVQRVMPETAIHMRTLLPELTAFRYRDVRLQTDQTENADLHVQVWDQVAGRYLAKNIFSGGTRDQVSLALRLSFALATLPIERGVIPGFIFLDEPLSSFDEERTKALVAVLTRGTIARHFPQVVLISHSQSFDTTSVRYHVRMADGRVVESNLPDEAVAHQIWQAESAVADTITTGSDEQVSTTEQA